MEFLQKPPTWLTDPLPQEARDVLTGGGWYAVLGLAALVVLFILFKLARAVLPRGRQQSRPQERNELEVDLGELPPPTRPPGPKRLTFNGVPVRLRLAVLAPAGTEFDVNPRATAQLLDRVVPGLGDVAAYDQAPTRVWPGQLSHQGFTAAVFRNLRRPGAEGEPSPWVIVAGRARVAKQQVLVALALLADEETTLDRRALEPHEWQTVLRVRGPRVEADED